MKLYDLCKIAEKWSKPISIEDLEALRQSLDLVTSMSTAQDIFYMDSVHRNVYYFLTKKDNAYFLKVGENLLYVTEDLVISATNPINHSVLYAYAKSNPIDMVLTRMVFKRDYPNINAYISAFNLIAG